MKIRSVGMPFRAEHYRLRKVLEVGEEIRASDFISLDAHGPGGLRDEHADSLGSGGVSGRMVLVLTDRKVHVVAPGGMISARLDRLIGVGRRGRNGKGRNAIPAQVQLIFPGNAYWNLTYDPRAAAQETGDLITESFFGRVIADTIEEFAQAKRTAPLSLGSRQRSSEVGSGLTYGLGDTVEICEGPLRDYAGQIKEISDEGNRIRVDVNVMGGGVQTFDFDITKVRKQ
jgi:hypothetical protein